jgi:4-hydroxy-2-oxoheptanedioate aldolase
VQDPHEPDSLAARVRSGHQVLATWCSLDSPSVAELVAAAGFDAVILDLEHGEFSVSGLAGHLRAVEVAGAGGLVRVRVPEELGPALDAGADGVLVPDVSSAEDARRVVQRCTYAPLGVRGAAPMARDAGYGHRDFSTHHAQAAPLVGVQIEGPSGVDAVGAIVAVEGLDLVFVGPHDLSQRLGVPGQVTHPSVVAAIGDVAESARAHGVATGVWAPDVEAARTWLDVGITLVSVSNATVMLAAAARATVDALRRS